MCLIIHQPRGVTLSRAVLNSAAERNPHGFGIMWADRGLLHVRRTLSAVDAIALYREHGAGRECVLHWRMATHGRLDLDNSHPFELGRGVAVMHNGILDCRTPVAGMSDTWHWARHILAPIVRDDPGALFNPETVEVLAGAIGSGNKLVALDAAGRVSVIGRERGVQHGGCWYSNTYAWDAPAHLCGGNRTVWGAGRGSWPAGGDLWDGRSAVTVDRLPVALVDAWDVDGEAGVLRWVTANPAGAAEVLADWYELQNGEEAYLVRENPDAVAGWLAELVEAER